MKANLLIIQMKHKKIIISKNKYHYQYFPLVKIYFKLNL